MELVIIGFLSVAFDALDGGLAQLYDFIEGRVMLVKKGGVYGSVGLRTFLAVENDKGLDDCGEVRRKAVIVLYSGIVGFLVDQPTFDFLDIK